MKIETVPAATLKKTGRPGQVKYREMYVAIDAVKDGQAVKITFDSLEDLKKFRNAASSRYKSADWFRIADESDFTIAFSRRAPAEPLPVPYAHTKSETPGADDPFGGPEK
jgi:hypothetical protein